MALSPETVASLATEYQSAQPLAAIEAEHLEMLPETFASGDYGWRDAEWVVQWYFRRFLGAYPDAERRAAEDAFGENSFEEVRSAITNAIGAAETAEKLDHLTTLQAVDVPVGSAFLQFIDPDEYVVVSAREWGALRTTEELDGQYPDQPTIRAYERYLETCRTVADRCDCSLWALYRTLWMLGAD